MCQSINDLPTFPIANGMLIGDRADLELQWLLQNGFFVLNEIVVSMNHNGLFIIDSKFPGWSHSLRGLMKNHNIDSFADWRWFQSGYEP